MSDWDEAAGAWDGDEATRAYAAAAFASLLLVTQSAGLTLDGARVLDFGCGTGLLTEHLVDAGATVTAVDTSPAMIAVLDAKIVERGWTTVHTMTSLEGDTGGARNLTGSSLTGSSLTGFELVVCSSVLGFVDDYPGTVADLASRLRPGGLFVQWDWERTDSRADGGQDAEAHGLSRDEVEAALTGAGLADRDVLEAFRVLAGEHTMAPIMGHGLKP